MKKGNINFFSKLSAPGHDYHVAQFDGLAEPNKHGEKNSG